MVLHPKLSGPAPTVEFTKVKHVDPEYPSASRRAKLGASVEMYIVVDENGTPRTPVFSGDCSLAHFYVAAADALKQWRYQPIVVEGQPATIITKIRVDFTLHP